jgi:hypothetical protein
MYLNRGIGRDKIADLDGAQADIIGGAGFALVTVKWTCAANASAMRCNVTPVPTS